jgi:MFS family permease
MSLGGEVSNASAYLAEIAPPNRRGRYSSFFYISTGTAVLLASLLGALLANTLADDQLANWGWRIPFLIGAGLGLVGMWMRRDMAETEQFVDNVAKARAIKNPPHADAARVPEVGRPTYRCHPAQHALLLHILFGIDPVRGQGQRAR